MVGVIVRLHLALTRNRMTGAIAAQRALGATLGFALALATIVLAFLTVPEPARLDLLAVVLGLWLVGWLVAPSFTGGPELTGQYFRLHPVPRGTLTRGLFAAAWTGLPAIVTLVAFGVLVAVAAPRGPAPVLVALVAMVLSVSLLVVGARLTAIWFAAVSRSRLGAAISAMVTAAIIVVAQHSWLIFIAIAIHLDTGIPGPLGTVLRALPSSWGLVAVTAAGEGAWGLAAAAVTGLAVLTGALFLLWTRVVASAPLRGAVVRPRRRARTPALGGARKELLGWLRNPLRVQDLVLALAYAVGTCALPLIVDFGALLPFLGIVTMIMGAATSCNLYASDGTALWMMLATPGSERGDVRGRQRAWLLVFGGLGAVLTVVGLALHPDPVLLPWVIAGFLAVLGAGAGLSVFLSVYAPAPMPDLHTAKHAPAAQGDAAGGAFVAIFLTLLVAAPTVGVLIAGQLTRSDPLTWTGIALGLLTAVLAPVLLGRAAIRRLATRGPELLHVLGSGAQGSDAGQSAGALTRTALREAFGMSDEAAGGPAGAEPAPVSGFTAMRPAESLTFWVLYLAAVLAVVPQGLVAGGHLLAGSGATGWFLALRMPEDLQWLTVAGFLLLGTLLAAVAMGIYLRAKRREQRRRDAAATP